MELILHHYDFSSFSEKVRLVMGLKRLSWLAVEIPAYAPKPDYTPLTAGYRRTPALQIGADVYCDTRLIVEVLEALQPEPSLYPGPNRARTRALCEGLTAWAESQMFRPLALYITGLHAERFPAEFHADRARLHGKPGPTLAQVLASSAKYQAQVEAQLGWIEDLLATGDSYILGDSVSLADILVYETPWFLETIGGPSPLLDRQPRTRAWMTRVAALGQGSSKNISASAALDHARAATPTKAAVTDYKAPEGIAPGDRVVVAPLDQHAPAEGVLTYIDGERMTLMTRDDSVGEVAVHFPRLGYRIKHARA